MVPLWILEHWINNIYWAIHTWWRRLKWVAFVLESNFIGVILEMQLVQLWSQAAWEKPKGQEYLLHICFRTLTIKVWAIHIIVWMKCWERAFGWGHNSRKGLSFAFVLAFFDKEFICHHEGGKLHEQPIPRGIV